MKKSVAAILSLAVVLSMTGCTSKSNETRTEWTPDTTKATTTKESETTESETSESTTESEETTTATESETTETSETSETSESETTKESETSASESESETKATESETRETEPTETTETPEDLPLFEVRHDLQNLRATREIYQRARGVLCENAYNNMAYVKEDFEYYDFHEEDRAKYDQLMNTIDSIYDGRANMLDYKYDTKSSTFYEDAKKYDSDTIYSEGTSSYWSKVFMSRCDSQIVSFRIVDWFEDGDYSRAYLNYMAEDGRELTLDDVVTNRKLFAGEIKNYILPDPDDEWEKTTSERYNQGLKNLISDIENGKDVDFLLYSNAIRFFFDVKDSDNYTYNYNCTVSIANRNDCIDMSYFGATTKYYSLLADENNTIIWDFNEDHETDRVSMVANGDKLTFTYNNTISEIEIPSADVSDAGGYDMYCMCFTDGGFYLYVTAYMEDPVDQQLCFHLNGEKFEYVGETLDFDDFPFDPSNFCADSRCDILGTGYMIIQSSIVGNEGMIKPIDGFYMKEGLGVTKYDMTLSKYSEDGPFSGDTIKIPAGTTVRMIGIDADHEMALLATCNEDASKDEMFYMACWRDKSNQYDDYDFTIKYNSMNDYELFDGVLYAD